jgi:hypothetical protein
VSQTFSSAIERESEIGDIVIATLNNTATPDTATLPSTLSDTLGSLFAELDLHLAGTTAGQTDLVIDQLDQWTNSDLVAGGSFSEVTWSFVPELTQR